MATLKRKNQINLLPRDNFDETVVGRVVGWLLSTFRIIVIVTEVVVIAAFLARFGIDAKNSDLSDEIEEKQSVIATTTEFEEKFKKTQEQLKLFSVATNENNLTSQEIETLVNLLPPEIFLNSLALNNGLITVNGLAPSERAIGQFMVNLGNSDKYSSVNLASVKSDESNANLVEFSILAKQ